MSGYTELFRQTLDSFVMDVHDSGAFALGVKAFCYFAGSFLLYQSAKALMPSEGKGTLQPGHVQREVFFRFLFALAFIYAPTFLDSAAYSIFSKPNNGKFGYGSITAGAAPWASLGVLINMLGYAFAVLAINKGKKIAVDRDKQHTWFGVGIQILAAECMINLRPFMIILGGTIGRGDLGKGIFY